MKNTLVSNKFDLEMYLEKECGTDIETDSFQTLLTGGVVGVYKRKKFNITFGKNSFLLISLAGKNKEAAQGIVDVLTKVMNNEGPICSYNLTTKDNPDNDTMLTYEWDIKDPETRVKEVVNGRAFSDDSICLDICLYGNRDINSYIETLVEKEEVLKNAKIYGVYPGFLSNVEAINNLDEVELYFTIDSLAHMLFATRHATKRDEVLPDLSEEEYALEYCVYQAKKFGVEFEEIGINKHVNASTSYNAWFSFYNNHFKKVLTDIEWKQYQIAKKNGENVSGYMPTGIWTDNLPKNKTKKLVK